MFFCLSLVGVEKNVHLCVENGELSKELQNECRLFLFTDK